MLLLAIVFQQIDFASFALHERAPNPGDALAGCSTLGYRILCGGGQMPTAAVFPLDTPNASTYIQSTFCSNV